ncbi:MAG: phosphogluconate dehydratase [Steroidobacteraceae bacterium]|nr:phosphogluconate dehydratase [Steroidobacteraceae bacterium]
MNLHPILGEVTQRIAERSREQRADYLGRMRAAGADGPARAQLPCSNFAHVFAAAGADQPALRRGRGPNLAIVTAYNDMLSAHQPFESYPRLIRAAAREAGATAQVAGGVPAMCDGVTQGRAGMELSLFSRDVIALSTAVALSHASFDASLLLGVCDKIVPGLFIGMAAFGHLPALFVSAGPMPSGIPNAEKARIRQAHAAGRATPVELLEAESASYHAPGTCTFYGTANSNQMLLEAMGLMVPGAAFVPPGTPLRAALTRAATWRAATLADNARDGSFAATVDERSIVNAVVTLMATGGSTNHTLHLVAMARAVGLALTWDDLAALSAVTPLLARIYPNGVADVNHFQEAGGFAFLARQLLRAGLFHGDARTVWDAPLHGCLQVPDLDGERLVWRDPPAQSANPSVLRGVDEPFAADGGLRVLDGNLGRAVVKVSAVKPEHWWIEAPVRVFEDQAQLEAAFRAGQLDQDFVAVVRFQGPRANGMPELHKLVPLLAVLQDRGRKVALVTDGRMSGASGKVLAAIHATPEAIDGGPLARLVDGDVVRIDATRGTLEALVATESFAARPVSIRSSRESASGTGRELFGLMRREVGSAERGASFLFAD